MARIRVQIHEGLTGADRDGEAARRANAIAPSIAYALREGRVVTIEDSAPHANQKIGGVSPPLDIEEVRTLRSHAADCLSKKNKRVLIDPARVVQLCDAIERGFVVVKDASPAPSCAPNWTPRNERCSTVPVVDDGDEDARDDQRVSGLRYTGETVPILIYDRLLDLLRRIVSRRDYWRSCARLARSTNALLLDANRTLHIESMRGDAGTIRRLRATVNELRNGLAEANIDRDTLVALFEARLRDDARKEDQK